MHLKQLLEAEEPLHTFQRCCRMPVQSGVFECCRARERFARERFNGEAAARVGILARICLDLEPAAPDPTLSTLDFLTRLLGGIPFEPCEHAAL